MADHVRLFGRFNLQRRGARRVESVRLRVQAPVPVGAVVRVTDVQLQPGRFVTGWTLNTRDLGVQPVSGWSWRNAVVSGRRDLVIVADVASASPTVWDLRGTAIAARVGQYLFGSVGAAGARVDGSERTATQGAGIPPHITARADVTIPATIEGGRVLATCWFRGLASAPVDRGITAPAPAHADGPLTEAHAGWWQVLAAHPSWGATRAAHPSWR